MRGTLPLTAGQSSPRRFLPARAGNAPLRSPICSISTVHPRACGERFKQTARPSPITGSSPRVRGTRFRRCQKPPSLRFIPARAGNAPARGAGRGPGAVHPRACGERSNLRDSPSANAGSSPRVRGTPSNEQAQLSALRFIPARAGNACGGRRQQAAAAVHPRACGERRCMNACCASSAGSSPRVRGTRAL